MKQSKRTELIHTTFLGVFLWYFYVDARKIYALNKTTLLEFLSSKNPIQQNNKTMKSQLKGCEIKFKENKRQNKCILNFSEKKERRRRKPNERNFLW